MPVRIPNPYESDPMLAGARHKWGVPKLMGQADDGLWHYVCEACGAGWVGPMGDTCSWCHDRWELELAQRVADLLYPPWMVKEGPRFDELGSIDQAVWQSTRGTRSTPWSENQWAIDLEQAEADGIVTESQAASALGRFERWDQLRNSMRDAKQD